jgi:hypothetical protein
LLKKESILARNIGEKIIAQNALQVVRREDSSLIEPPLDSPQRAPFRNLRIPMSAPCPCAEFCDLSFSVPGDGKKASVLARRGIDIIDFFFEESPGDVLKFSIQKSEFFNDAKIFISED